MTIFCLILVFPENSGSLFPSLPIDNLVEFLIAIVTVYLFVRLRSNRKVFSILFFTIFIFKLILIIQPTDMWRLCYQDDLAKRFGEEIGQTVDNKFECEKVYHLNVGNNSTLKREINYFSKPDSEWLGANGSNFELSFFNNKKFNFKADGQLDRKWLPFSLTITKDLDSQIESLSIVYVGDLTVYKNKEKVYEGRTYLKKNRIQINELGNQNIEIVYKFEKSDGNEVRLKDTSPRNYPPDLYGKLQIFDSNSNILKTEKTIVTQILEIIFLLIIFTCIFLVVQRNFFNALIQYILHKRMLLLFYSLLLYLIFKPDLISAFPVFFIFDSFTVSIYLFTFLIFYFLI